MFDGPEGALKSPSPLPWLDGVALRDLALRETHAGCVDARGDVYQWGRVSTQGNVATRPVRTLRGKVRAWTFRRLDDQVSLMAIYPEHQAIGDQRGQTRSSVSDGRHLCVICHECSPGILNRFQILGRRG